MPQGGRDKITNFQCRHDCKSCFRGQIGSGTTSKNKFHWEYYIGVESFMIVSKRYRVPDFYTTPLYYTLYMYGIGKGERNSD